MTTIEIPGASEINGFKALRIEYKQWPFLLLRYSIRSTVSPLGIRLDMGKRDEHGKVLPLDHFTDPNLEEGLQKSMDLVQSIVRAAIVERKI